MKRENYRPDIDGLRAVAVMAVVFYHAQLGCTGGFVGVDVFFVISGYLITRILEKDLAAGPLSITAFYERRIRRIFPAFFVMILVVGMAGIRFLPPLELQDLSKSILMASAFLSNLFFSRKWGYFGDWTSTPLLLHTWTLSVEEQFYLIWPWILVCLQWRRLKRWRVSAVIAIIAGSLMLSNYWLTTHGTAAFYLLPSRAFELAIGALLSISPVPEAMQRIPRRAAEVASIVGLAVILLAIVSYNNRTPFPGIAALLPCLGAAMVIAAGEGGTTLVGKLLSMRPMAWIGLISYSLYLWHFPILFFVRFFLFGNLTRSGAIAGVGFALLVSWFSWRFVESPFRNRQAIGGSSGAWVVAGVTTAAAFLVAGVALDGLEGLPGRSPEVARWASEQVHRGTVGLIQSPCLVWGENLPPAQTCLLKDGAQKTGYSVVLWGDSFAAQLAPAFRTIDQQYGLVTREVTKAGCSPVIGIRFVSPNELTIGCPPFNENVMQNLLADKRVRVVVIAGYWNGLAAGEWVASSSGATLSHSESRRLFVEGMRRTVGLLTSSGRQVVLVSYVPLPPLDPVTCLSRARFNGWNESGCETLPASLYVGEESQVASAFAEATHDLPGVRTVDPFDRLCDRDSCRFVGDGEPYYWDGHLTETGASLLVPELGDALKDAVQAAGMQMAVARNSAGG